jgi:hypothetical protein
MEIDQNFTANKCSLLHPPHWGLWVRCAGYFVRVCSVPISWCHPILWGVWIPMAFQVRCVGFQSRESVWHPNFADRCGIPIKFRECVCGHSFYEVWICVAAYKDWNATHTSQDHEIGMFHTSQATHQDWNPLTKVHSFRDFCERISHWLKLLEFSFSCSGSNFYPQNWDSLKSWELCCKTEQAANSMRIPPLSFFRTWVEKDAQVTNFSLTFTAENQSFANKHGSVFCHRGVGVCLCVCVGGGGDTNSFQGFPFWDLSSTL